jgi:hypothetical protein
VGRQGTEGVPKPGLAGSAPVRAPRAAVRRRRPRPGLCSGWHRRSDPSVRRHRHALARVGSCAPMLSNAPDGPQEDRETRRCFVNGPRQAGDPGGGGPNGEYGAVSAERLQSSRGFLP